MPARVLTVSLTFSGMASRSLKSAGPYPQPTLSSPRMDAVSMVSPRFPGRAQGECEATIADASATLLARLGVKPADDAAGRVLFEILGESLSLDAELPEATFAPKRAGNPSFLERRLRALGYVD